MQKGQTLDFTFEIPEAGDYLLKTGTIPNHDVDGEGMKIEVLLNGKAVGKQDYSVEGRNGFLRISGKNELKDAKDEAPLSSPLLSSPLLYPI